MFVAIARIPEHPEALKRAAMATGQALADVSRLLAGTLPRILVRATQDGDGLVQALEALGFLAFTGDVAAVPGDSDRVVARGIEWLAGGFAALDGRGQQHLCTLDSLALFQRGSRVIETSEIIKRTEKRLDVGRALLSGGLMLTKKVETTSVRTDSNKEAFLLIQRGDGRPEIIIHERRFNYACMGAAIQSSTHGNLMALLLHLRTIAPEVPFDDRVNRPGFVAGLPLMAADPVDLALHLTAQAQRRGC